MIEKIIYMLGRKTLKRLCRLHDLPYSKQTHSNTLRNQLVPFYSDLNALLQNLYKYEIADICNWPYLEQYPRDEVRTTALQFFQGKLDKNKWMKEHGYFYEENEIQDDDELQSDDDELQSDDDELQSDDDELQSDDDDEQEEVVCYKLPLEFDPTVAVQKAYPFQQDIINLLHQRTQTNNIGEKLCVRVATGGGKTRIANDWLSSKIADNKKVLWITIRWELLDQAASDLCRRYPDVINKIGRVGGQHHLPQLSEIRNNTQLVYTTIHTWNARLRKIFRRKQFDYVIIDEVHWGEGQPMFNRLIQHYENQSVFIGLTATPHKNSKFQDICSNFDFHNLVSMNYLAKPIPDPKPTGVQWNPQRFGQKGDFRSDSLNELSINYKRNQLIVDTYKQNIKLYGKTLIFACNINHAEILTNLFQEQDFFAEVLHSDMSIADRQGVISNFRATRTNILINVSIMIYGIDIPDIETIFMARPTASSVLFSQITGRACRLTPTKSSFRIVDFVDNLTIHGESLISSINYPEFIPFVRLASPNPDKGKYPDIVLQPENDDAISVVAELIAPLSPSDYGREPKSIGKKDRRDINSPEGKEKIANRLQKRINEFFTGSPYKHEGVDDKETAEDVWTSRFICLDAAAGGLHIEAGPLSKLPPFARKLQVSSGSRVWPAIASNFRTKTWLLPVDPSSEPYHWSAPGFEDVLDEEFTSMRLDGLSDTSVSIFRIDAAGAGLALSGSVLTPGKSCRLMIPPSLSSVRLPESEAFFLGEGWRLWEISLPVAPDTAWCALLESLRIGIGKSEPDLSWVIVPPARYRQAPSGESYPCFSADQVPILHVHGMQPVSEGEAAVFLSGPGRFQTLSLSSGDALALELRDLKPGNYMVEVLFQSTDIEPSRLPFAVEESAVRAVPASLTAVVDGVSYDIHQLGSAIAPGEFSWLEGMDVPIAVTGPPLFPVSVIWKSGKARRLKLAALSADGCLDMEQVRVLTEELRTICRASNLVIDCRELGRLTLQLDRRTDPDELIVSLKHLVTNQGQAVQALMGQTALLRSIWLGPLLRLMNYEMGEMDSEYLADAPVGTMALKLFETSRTHQGNITEGLRRVLVLTATDADFHKMAPGTVRSYAESLCWKCGVVEAIVTDGLCWFLHKRGSKLRPPIWDLRKLSDDENSFDMDAFLSNCAVGV